MATRSIAVTAAVAAGAALVATGITYASAASEPVQAAPFAAPQGSSGNNNSNNNDNYNDNYNSKGNEGHHHEHGEEHEHERHHHGEGRIFVNEREYSPHESSCITVVSGLGANSLNIRNDSKKFVEVFNGATCDNGAPIATVGPHSSSNGLFPRRVRGGVKVKHGVVGSIRIVHRFDEDHGDHDDNDDEGNSYEYDYSYRNNNNNDTSTSTSSPAPGK
ncbi:hypothetical protein [Streptomyces gibsoniae]|uniref:Uncharacterized protein n=1 Tax=Streptomyces gibsoniae TaxID=3075529 RepID=A0ABU2TZ36_9ACTN|nr:hypothetical protein [Streptomyces sp. DSM 41699]MDT0466194.1 hypothetical protein [Streptomyces sp. DSM 41699]